MTSLAQALENISTFIRTLLDDADAATALATLGAEASANIVKGGITSDFTTSSATYTNVTGASITLPASGTYLVIIVAPFQSPATNTGVGLSLTLTNTPSPRAFYRRVAATATTGTDAALVADDDGAIGATIDIANVDRVCHMEGIVKTGGSAAVLQLRAARGGTSGTITVRAGTSIIAHKIA